MCKPMLVTLPLVLLLLDYWPLNRVAAGAGRGHPLPISRRLILEKLPLFGLAAAACVATLFAQTVTLASVAQISLPLRVGNALISYVTYLGQMFWPSGLAVLYPFTVRSVGGSAVVLSLAVLAGVSAGVFVLGRGRPYFLTGWLWYLVMLVPVIGIVQVGDQTRADRYTYLPQIGLYILVTWAAADWCAGWRHRRVVLGGLATVVLVALTWCAHTQTSYWRDSESLWTHTLACTSGNFIGQNNLGNALLQNGDVDDAITHFQEALQINPGYAEAHINLGNALFQRGKVDEAIAQYQRALQINPDYAEAHYNLGNALLRQGSVDEAIAQYQRALQIRPDYAHAHGNLGNALLQKGNVDEAVAHFQRALQIKPGNATAHNNLGNALLRKGSVGEAIVNFRKALRINPDYAEAHYNLGNALVKRAMRTKRSPISKRRCKSIPITRKPTITWATRCSKRAAWTKRLRITKRRCKSSLTTRKPTTTSATRCSKGAAWTKRSRNTKRRCKSSLNTLEAHNNLGNALLQKGSVDEAITHFQKALQINPDYAEAQNNLAWVLATCPQASLRNGNKAVELAQRANQLTGDGNPVVLGTLAAAYAEAGRFPEAVETAQRALQLAETQSNARTGRCHSITTETLSSRHPVPFTLNPHLEGASEGSLAAGRFQCHPSLRFGGQTLRAEGKASRPRRSPPLPMSGPPIQIVNQKFKKQPTAGKSVSHPDAPHAFGSGEGSASNRILDPERFDVAIVERIIETVVVRRVQKLAFIYAVCRSGILGLRARIYLKEIPGSLRADATTSPDVAGNLLAMGVFHQHEGPRRVAHNVGRIAQGIPVGSRCTCSLPVYADAQFPDLIQILQPKRRTALIIRTLRLAAPHHGVRAQ